MLSIREWYALSRGGTRGRFFAQLDDDSPEKLVQLLRRELEFKPVASLRSFEDLRGYARVPLPTPAELKGRAPLEQTLQYVFMHRGYFRRPAERVVAREYPTCDRAARRTAVIDLIAFDVDLQAPLIVELKRARADDPLFGVLLEALHHWAFLIRNRGELARALQGEGYIWATDAPLGLAIAAPQRYFSETKRRSVDDRVRNREYARALAALQRLADEFRLFIPLVEIADDWADNGSNFSTSTWWQPTIGREHLCAVSTDPTILNRS